MRKYKPQINIGIWAFLTVMGVWLARGESVRARTKPYLRAPTVALHVPWEEGSVSPGRRGGNESAPEGPMSFDAVGRDIYILDEAKYRVVRYSGCSPTAPTTSCVSDYPLPGGTFQDLKVTSDGKILVLDRLVRRSILVMGVDGESLGEYPIEGYGIFEGGGVTAMFARPDGVWLEYAHAHLVRVLDEFYHPSPRVKIPGRFHASEPYSIGARLDGVGGVDIWLTDLRSGMDLVAGELFFDYDVARIIWVDSDAQGRIYVVLHLLEYDPVHLSKVIHERDVGVVLDENLFEIGYFESPHVIGFWEQFQEFRITQEGTIYQMAFSRDGVDVYEWRWSW